MLAHAKSIVWLHVVQCASIQHIYECFLQMHSCIVSPAAFAYYFYCQNAIMCCIFWHFFLSSSPLSFVGSFSCVRQRANCAINASFLTLPFVRRLSNSIFLHNLSLYPFHNRHHCDYYALHRTITTLRQRLPHLTYLMCASLISFQLSTAYVRR